MRNVEQKQHQRTATLIDVLKILHLFNGVGSACGVAVGYLVTAWHHGLDANLFTCTKTALVTLLISSGGFIVNDILDVEIDRINRPDRPIAAGIISIRLAWCLYVLCTAAGILIGATINGLTAATAVLIVTLLFLYSYRLKKMFLIGHLTIAGLGALLLPFGGMADGRLLPTVYTIPITFTAFLGREILKTVPDIDGDRLHGIANIATRGGSTTALRIARLNFALAAIMLPLLQLVWDLNLLFMITVLFVVWPMVIFLLIMTYTANDVYKSIRLSKLIFLLVIVPLLSGSVR